MAAATSTLLRDWDLLQRQVVPPLLATDHTGPVSSWTPGNVEDAIALGVAYEFARSAARRASMDIYAGRPDGQGPIEAGFTAADLSAIPGDERSSFFVRHQRRWVVDETIAEQVILGDPNGAVDLVTLRSSQARNENRVGEVVRQLRPGGQMLLVLDDPDTIEVHHGDLEQIADGEAGFVFRKSIPNRSDWQNSATEPVGGTTLANHRAQEELVESHVRLAASLARRFAHRGEPLDDLEQVAMLALVKAAKRFDPERHTRFATYATSSILGELKRHFRDKTWMLRVSRPVQELYLEIKQARDELTQTLGGSPGTTDIARHLGVSEEAVLEAIDAGGSFWPASLDGRTGDDSQTDIPVTDRNLERSLDRLQIQRLMPGLDSREQFVLRRIYFDDLTQRDVAEELGVSQMQVSRLLARALAKLRS